MRDTVHPVSVGFWENPNPGSDGTTTSNESAASPPNETGSVSGPISFRNSTIKPGQELGEAIEPGLEAPPVVAALPVADQRSGVLYANPLRPVAHRFRIRPSSSGQSLLHVVDLRIRDRDGERADEGRGRRRRCGHCLLLFS